MKFPAEIRRRAIGWGAHAGTFLARNAATALLKSKRPSSQASVLSGKLIRASLPRSGRRASLRRLDDTMLDQLGRRDEQTALLLLGKSTAELAPEVLLSAATMPEMRGAVVDALENNAHAAEVVDLVVDVVHRIPTDERVTLLSTATKIAQRLSDGQARSLLIYCLDSAAVDPGPYARPDLSVAARRTAAALLREHPLLDGEVRSRLASGQIGAVLDVYAAALSRRSYARDDALASMFESWQPNRIEALAFARRADVVRLRTQRSRRPPHTTRTFIRDLLRIPAGWLLVPAILMVTGGLAWSAKWGPAPVRLGFGEAIAAIAVVAAVHVVSAQLAAGRLDGVIARRSASSKQLVWSYMAALALAVAGFLTLHGRIERAVDWAAVAAAAAFLLSITLAAVVLVKQSEPANAAAVFVKSQRLNVRWSGWRLGRMRRRAVELKESLAGMREVVLLPDPRYVDRRMEFVASRRGFHFVHERTLRKLRERPTWQAGHTRLQVLDRLGTLVDVGQEVGALVPDEFTALLSREQSSVRRAFRQQRASFVENVGEAAVVLIRFAADLAQRGDSGAAARVTNAVVGLLTDYSWAARVDREDVATRDTPLPVIWPLRAAAEAISTAIASSTSHLERECLCSLAERFVRVGGESDATIALLHTQLPQIEGAVSPLQRANLVRAMARRSLELGDYRQLLLVRSFVERRLIAGAAVDAAMAEAGSEIPAMAAWTFQPAAERLWDWYLGQCLRLPTSQELRMGAVRVGAANLVSGSVSVATRVALDLGAILVWATEMPQLRQVTLERQQRFSASDFGGGYLGIDPAVTLEEFFDFADRIVGAVV